MIAACLLAAWSFIALKAKKSPWLQNLLHRARKKKR
jgi:hypothetical protein